MADWSFEKAQTWDDEAFCPRQQEKLSRYSVEWQPDERHLARVGNPRFYQHPYQPPQQELWEAGSVEWFVIIRTDPPVRRRRRKSHLVVVQLPLLLDGTGGEHKDVSLPRRAEARSQN